ncbi:MAG: FAD-binding oxidoreductase [Gammaproteobacteria bacterium]|nr:FAD-binding oxidoreductase [Gammaproteobacteria bacterium]
MNTDRRRIIASMGSLAVASWLPIGVKAQNAMRESDMLIIGGGMAGAATAFQLARHGRDVTLVERGDIASEASGQNMGGLGGAGWGNTPDLQSYLTMGSLEIFKELQIDMGYDMEFRLSGSLTGIHTDEQHDFLEDRLLSLRSGGYDGELLTPKEARAIEPEVNLELAGYFYTPGRGQADPVRSTRAFADAARKAGASINTGQNVIAIVVRGTGGYSVRTESAEYICQTLVLATGSWCGPVGQMLGLRIPIMPIRGQMWATERLPPRFFQRISSAESSYTWSRDNGGNDSTPPYLTHKGDRRLTRHLYGRQRRNGEIIFGGDREDVGYNTKPDPLGIDVNKRHAAEVVPLVADLPIARTWAGLMPFSLDGSPIIGKIPLRDNLYIVSGLASSGFGRGPMAGKLAADYIHTGHMPHVLAEADPARCVTEVQ